MQQYDNTDQRLHFLSQLLAKINRTYVPKRNDDSHTNLSFDSARKRLFGRWFQVGNRSLIASIELETLQLNWLNNRFEIISEIQLAGKTMAQIERELVTETQALGLNTDGLIDPMHFEIPTYDFEQEKMAPLGINEITQWYELRSLANDASHWVLNAVQQSGEIRIWPHHFDTGIYVLVNPNVGIGFGLAMTDQIANEPYFYLSGYGQQTPIDYQPFSPLQTGRWENGEHWKGAILPVHEFRNQPRLMQQDTIQSFINEALNQILSAN